MRVTKKMLKNGYSGPGELDNAVAEFTDGKRNGLGVDESIAGEYKDDKLNGYAINKITKNINRYEENKHEFKTHSGEFFLFFGPWALESSI